MPASVVGNGGSTDSVSVASAVPKAATIETACASSGPRKLAAETLVTAGTPRKFKFVAGAQKVRKGGVKRKLGLVGVTRKGDTAQALGVVGTANPVCVQFPFASVCTGGRGSVQEPE